MPASGDAQTILATSDRPTTDRPTTDRHISTRQSSLNDLRNDSFQQCASILCKNGFHPRACGLLWATLTIHEIIFRSPQTKTLLPASSRSQYPSSAHYFALHLLLSELPEGKVLDTDIADLVTGLGQNSKELVDGIVHGIVVGLLGLVAGLGGLLVDLLRPALEVILVLLLADVFLLLDSLLFGFTCNWWWSKQQRDRARVSACCACRACGANVPMRTPDVLGKQKRRRRTQKRQVDSPIENKARP